MRIVIPSLQSELATIVGGLPALSDVKLRDWRYSTADFLIPFKPNAFSDTP